MIAKLAVSCLIALLCGCAVVPYYGPLPPGHAAGETRPVASQHVLVNNTGAQLDVLVDGQPFAQRLGSGQTLTVPYRVFYGRTVVTVLAYDPANNYLGTDSFVFYSSTPEVWTVNSVTPPNPERH